MIRPLVAAALAALTFISTPAGADTEYETRQETKLYTQLAGDDQVIDCGASDPDIGGLGGVCFDLWGDELSVKSIRIIDETGMAVGGYYSMRAVSDGESLSSSQFCDSRTDLAIPEGTTWIGIWIDGPVYGPQDCLLSHSTPGIGIRGHVEITYNLKPVE